MGIEDIDNIKYNGNVRDMGLILFAIGLLLFLVAVGYVANSEEPWANALRIFVIICGIVFVGFIGLILFVLFTRVL